MICIFLFPAQTLGTVHMQLGVGQKRESFTIEMCFIFFYNNKML